MKKDTFLSKKFENKNIPYSNNKIMLLYIYYDSGAKTSRKLEQIAKISEQFIPF